MKRLANTFGIALSVAALGFGCGAAEEQPEPNTARSYRTTSNVGDLSTWTIDGNLLTAEWQDIAPLTGEVEKTYLVSAVCGTPDAEFGNRICLVDGDAECVDGVASCEPGDAPQNGDTFNLYEIPNMAIMVSTDDAQLHAGFAASGCDEVATDDYTFVNIGLGQDEVLGLFRTDADFSTVYHMDFGFTDDPENRIAYKTGDPAGLVTGLTASACEDGVRDLTVESNNEKLRLIVTAAGHMIIDKAEGEGGLLAINGANAAVIEDFSNKSWGGIAFPDDRAPEFLSVTTGTAADGRVQLTSIVLSDSGDITPQEPVYLNDAATGPKLNEPMVENGAAYATNGIVIQGDYTGGPSELPGAFELDSVSGDETAILAIGATVDGKTMLFGSVVNVYEESRNGVKGNFILFEK